MKEIDSLVLKTKELLLGIVHDINPEEKEKYFKIIFWKGKFVAFPNSIKLSFSETLGLLKKKAKNQNLLISDKKLEDVLISFLIDTYYASNRKQVLTNMHKTVKDLIAKIREVSLSKYLVMVPLINLKAEIPLKIGHAEIVDLNTDKIRELNSTYGIDLVLHNREDEEKTIRKIQGDSRHPTVSIVIVEAHDKEKAEQMAIQATEQALNVLRFYTYDCRALLKGEELKEVERTIFCCNLADNTLSQNIEGCNMVDPDYPDEIIDMKLVRGLEKKELTTINDILSISVEHLTPLQSDIIKAIYWIGNAEKDSMGHDKLIKYIIALDTVLAQGRGDKSDIVAKRYTAIMCQELTDDDLVQRYCTIKAYYSLRNEIVHGGLSYIDNKILNQLRVWVSELVYNLLMYSTRYKRVTNLFERLFPVREDILKDVKCKNEAILAQ